MRNILYKISGIGIHYTHTSQILATEMQFYISEPHKKIRALTFSNKMKTTWNNYSAPKLSSTTIRDMFSSPETFNKMNIRIRAKAYKVRKTSKRKANLFSSFSHLNTVNGWPRWMNGPMWKLFTPWRYHKCR